MDKSYVDYIVDYLNMAYDHYNLKYINVCMYIGILELTLFELINCIFNALVFKSGN